jgi:hypothetical protein
MAFNDWFEIVVDELLDGETTITEAAIRNRGSNINRFASAIAAAAEIAEFEFNRQLAGGFLDTAEGDALRRLVSSDRDVQAHGETAARVELTLSRTNTTPAVTLDAGFVFATSEGVRFATETDVTWGETDDTHKPVLATCLTTGTIGNVAVGTVVLAEGSLPDSTITATNSAAAVGGAAAEDDAALIDRVRDITARLVRGTTAAIRLGALEVPQVRTVAVHESLDEDGNPNAGGFVVVGDSSGQANQALLDLVDDELENWRPIGIYIQTSGATIVYESITVSASWAPGQATSANALALRRAIVGRVNNLKPRSVPTGGTVPTECQLRHAIIHEAAATVPGCLGVDVTLPVGTVIPDFGEVIRTRLDLVAVA